MGSESPRIIPLEGALDAALGGKAVALARLIALGQGSPPFIPGWHKTGCWCGRCGPPACAGCWGRRWSALASSTDRPPQLARLRVDAICGSSPKACHKSAWVSGLTRLMAGFPAIGPDRPRVCHGLWQVFAASPCHISAWVSGLTRLVAVNRPCAATTSRHAAPARTPVDAVGGRNRVAHHRTARPFPPEPREALPHRQAFRLTDVPAGIGTSMCIENLGPPLSQSSARRPRRQVDVPFGAASAAAPVRSGPASSTDPRLLLRRQRQAKAGARQRRIVLHQLQCAAVGLGDGPGHGQAEAGAGCDARWT